MTFDEQFSSTVEQWREISDFPGYSVSNLGRVRRDASNTYITPTCKPQGLVMVGLMRRVETRDRSVQCKRSLPLLVANAFIPNSRPDVFDTPINLDGDRSNNRWDNLMWRPLWFARKYMSQFAVDHPSYDGMIEDVEAHITYENAYSAAVHNGLLEQEIVISMMNNTYVWPTGQVFRKVVA